MGWQTLRICCVCGQVETDEKMRLVLLFAIRYQAEGMRQLAELVDRLGAQGVPRARLVTK
jgi:hypothetical protein